MMKRIYYLFVLLIAFSACKKTAINADLGCISQSTLQRLPTAQYDTVLLLLKNKNISAANQVFYQYQSYTPLGHLNTDTLYQVTTATQTANGLPIFDGDLFYGFLNGKLISQAGTVYTNINLDTNPTLKLPAMRQEFLADADALDERKVPFQDSCLVAQFGYYNINTDFTNPTPNFVKAWQVKPVHTGYPIAYIRDDNGKSIYFVALGDGSHP
jgi:hypothetical protein